MLTKGDLVEAVKAALTDDEAGPDWAEDYGDHVQVDGDVRPGALVDAVLKAAIAKTDSLRTAEELTRVLEGRQ